jgi:hypothetical protein
VGPFPDDDDDDDNDDDIGIIIIIIIIIIVSCPILCNITQSVIILSGISTVLRV